MSDAAVLLSKTCPTGQHVGSVAAYYTGFLRNQLVVPWPPRYLCGCVKPTTKRTCYETCGGDAGFSVPHRDNCPLREPERVAARARTWLDY
jgi:hypothetical protein